MVIRFILAKMILQGTLEVTSPTYYVVKTTTTFHCLKREGPLSCHLNAKVIAQHSD